MNIRNLKTCAELRSENPVEAVTLLMASMSSYSPRAAGVMPNDDSMIVLNQDEAEEFSAGVLRDVRIASPEKWAIGKLIACWMSGEIADEASANARTEDRMSAYQPKTGAKCGCRRGQQRDNCGQCEGTGWIIDFAAIRARHA